MKRLQILMYLVLSYFNEINGPEILMTTEPLSSESLKKQILALMDLHNEEGFFEYAYTKDQNDILTANYLFFVSSTESRGGVITMMITLILEPTQFPNNYKTLLETSAQKIKMLPHLDKFIKGNLDEIKINSDFITQELEKILHVLLLNCEKISIKKIIGPIYMFGMPRSGKSSIILQATKSKFENKYKPTKSLHMGKIILENHILNLIEICGGLSGNTLWKRIPRLPLGLIYLLDCTGTRDQSREMQLHFIEIMNHYHSIITPEKSIPILILANKSDLNHECTTKSIQDLLEIQKFSGNFTIVLTSAKNNTGIDHAFQWLTNQLL